MAKAHVFMVMVRHRFVMVPALDNHLIALTTVTDQFPGQVSTEQPFTRKQLEVELLNIAGGIMDPVI